MTHDDGGQKPTTGIRRQQPKCEPPKNERIAKAILMAACALLGNGTVTCGDVCTELHAHKERYEITEADISDISDAAVNFVLDCNRLFKLCPGK